LGKFLIGCHTFDSSVGGGLRGVVDSTECRGGLTCTQKLIASQLSLPHVTEQTENLIKNKLKKPSEQDHDTNLSIEESTS